MLCSKVAYVFGFLCSRGDRGDMNAIWHSSNATRSGHATQALVGFLSMARRVQSDKYQLMHKHSCSALHDHS